MNKKIGTILKLLISILILLFFEIGVFKVFDLTRVDVNKFSNTVINIIKVSIKLVMSIIIYFLYKKDFHKRKTNKNIFKNIILLIISLIIITVIMSLFDYITTYLCDVFKINKLNITTYNIFNKKINLDLIINFFSDYVFIPFIYISTIILGVSKVIKRSDIYILLSGLVALILYGLNLDGTVLFIILNSLNVFLLFGILAFLYKRFNNIWYIITLYSLYLLSGNIIINYLGL